MGLWIRPVTDWGRHYPAVRLVAGRPVLRAELTLASAHIALRSSPSEAETSLRQVIKAYKDEKYELGLSSAYIYHAEARAALGMIDSARASFDSATGAMARQRRSRLCSAARSRRPDQ
jgi:hypothetical protein